MFLEWVSLPSPVLVPKKEEEEEKGKEEQDWGSALNSAKLRDTNRELQVGPLKTYMATTQEI